MILQKAGNDTPTALYKTWIKVKLAVVSLVRDLDILSDDTFIKPVYSIFVPSVVKILTQFCF